MKPEAGKRGLGRQAPAVLAGARSAPNVLIHVGAQASPDIQAIRAMQVAAGKLKTEHEALRADLGDALDNWETVASAPDQARIEALRKRWGLRAADATDTGDAD